MTASVTFQDACKRVLLDRADRRNALSADLVERLIEIVTESYSDGTRLLELSGAGRNTCAGFDMSDVDAASEGDLVLRFVRIEHLLQLIYHAPFHTLVFAHGRVVGAGADLVLACRHRIGTPDVQFEMPGAGFGLVLGTGRLRETTGQAAGDLLSGPFDALKAVATDFLTEIATREDWEAKSDRLLKEAVALDDDTNRAILRVLRPDRRAVDMMELVQSAARPGLKDRIARYIAARKGGAK